MVLRIADRIRIAVGHGCQLKTLREGLADIDPGHLDYALQGLISEGLLTLIDGFIASGPAQQKRAG